MSETFLRRISIVSAAFLFAAATFAYGLAVERYQLWPYELLHSAKQAADSLAEFGEIVPEGRRVPAPPGAARRAMTLHAPERIIADGYYVFVGWDSEAMLYAAWLYDSRGKRRHTWQIVYNDLDADGPSNGADNPHPFQVLRDGSIIVGFDKGDVMARLDTCGNPMWIKDGIYHHQMSRADDGSMWVWRGDGGTAYGHYNYIENFDPSTGETIKELALVEDIIEDDGPAALLFGVRADYPFTKFERDPEEEDEEIIDIFHPNDVDVLPAGLAPEFPMFEPGDLLLSFRSLNLVAVVDPDDRRLDWWSYGPWIGQHDPDFTADGKISVYNNNTNRNRSEIVKIDPATREVTNGLFGGEVSFYSGAMGNHQYLPNGNVLIVVPGEGRILEVSADGENVMEFNNLSSSSLEYNEHVENGLWVPGTYFQTVPQCFE